MRSSTQRSRTRRNHPVRRVVFRTVFCDDPTSSDAVRVCLSWCHRTGLKVRWWRVLHSASLPNEGMPRSCSSTSWFHGMCVSTSC